MLRLIGVPLLAAAVYALIDVIDGGNTALATLKPGVREALFVSAAATTGALLGFAITGVTVLLTVGQGPRMAWLKSKPLFRHGVRFVFFSAIAGLSVSTVVFLILIAVGSDSGFGFVWGLIATAATALTIDRLWRLVSFLNKLMDVALQDADDVSDPNPPFTEPTSID